MAELHQFNAEVSKVLQLMIHSLYTNKDIFLRELISNASDACDKRRYEALTNNAMAAEGELAIHVSYDRDAKWIEIADNGIGMNKEDMIANLGTIAKSGTQEFLSQLDKSKDPEANLIGQFGVGFYSSFMVADKVEVISRKAGETQAWSWHSDGVGDYEIDEASKEEAGTAIRLHMKDEYKDYLDFHRLKHIVETYSDHIAFPIFVRKEDGEFFKVNQASALWSKPKYEISEEQYQEFYRHVAHQPDAPWLTQHYKAEGTMEYTVLLYVPSMRPFDLFHPDRMRRVKLYVKRVFISEENVDLIPHYLRFLRGVVDSEDLPLNISRETLQANPVIGKIRDAITKKFLQELVKKAKNEPEGYLTFWQNFGPVMKEGLCEATSPKELLLETCLFFSSKHDKLITLKEYAEQMVGEQKEVFYLTGERLDVLKNDPKLEGFKARGIDVLLLNDHVDDFWLSVVPIFEGHDFVSVTRSDINLPELEEKPESEQSGVEAAAKKPENMDAVIGRIKAELEGKIADVRVTNKLQESPSCLAIAEGDMDIRLERFLLEQKQLQSAKPKILEINPKHALISKLAAAITQDAKKEEVSDICAVLLDQARIIEGEPLDDPAGFIKRINKYMVDRAA